MVGETNQSGWLAAGPLGRALHLAHTVQKGRRTCDAAPCDPDRPVPYPDYLERRNATDPTPTQAELYRRIDAAHRSAQPRQPQTCGPDDPGAAPQVIPPTQISQSSDARPPYAGPRIGDVSDARAPVNLTPIDIAYRRIVRAPTGQIIDMLA